MNKEKPPVLSIEKFAEVTGLSPDAEYMYQAALLEFEAQRDADVAYYEPLIEHAKFDGYELALEKLDIEFGKGYEAGFKGVEQAKAEVAKEIDTHLCILIRDVASKNVDAGILLAGQLTPIVDYLKSKYLGGK